MNRKLTSRSRSLLTIAGWLAATAAATMIGVLAVSAIGSGIAGTTARPLSAGEVSRALSTAGAVVPSPTADSTAGSATAGPSTTGSPAVPAGTSRVLGSKGGTVVARCVAGKAELLSWSPAQGFEADDIRRGPALWAGLEFESDRIEIKISVDCRTAVPTPHIETETRGRH